MKQSYTNEYFMKKKKQKRPIPTRIYNPNRVGATLLLIRIEYHSQHKKATLKATSDCCKEINAAISDDFEDEVMFTADGVVRLKDSARRR